MWNNLTCKSKVHPGEEFSGTRVDSLTVKKQIFARIREAQSWGELEEEIRARGYTLYPAEDDLFAVNFQTRDFLLLGDSGYFFPFLVERLGVPPERLTPSHHHKTN